MNLSKPPAQYDVTDQSQMRRSIEQADKGNMKIGGAFNSLVMIDKDTGARVTLTVESGVLVIT